MLLYQKGGFGRCGIYASAIGLSGAKDLCRSGVVFGGIIMNPAEITQLIRGVVILRKSWLGFRDLNDEIVFLSFLYQHVFIIQQPGGIQDGIEGLDFFFVDAQATAFD